MTTHILSLTPAHSHLTTAPSTATQTVLSLPELLHAILVLSIEAPAMLPLQRVCRRWRDVIRTSTTLHKQLYFRGSTVQHTHVDPEVSLYRRINTLTNTWEIHHSIFKWAARESMIMHMYSNAPINFRSLHDEIAPSPFSLRPSRIPWGRMQIHAWAHVWLGRAALERLGLHWHGYWDYCISITCKKTEAPMHYLEAQHRARRDKYLRELTLSPILSVPIGPCLEGEFIARAMILKDLAIVCVPRSTLESIDQMARGDRAVGRASWMQMPLTNPPVHEILLIYYFGEGTDTVQVNQVVRKRPRWPFVVLGDLVGCLREHEGPVMGELTTASFDA